MFEGGRGPQYTGIMPESSPPAPAQSAAERLQDLRPTIVAEYAAGLRAEGHAARLLSREAVIHSLPQLLVAVSEITDTPTTVRDLDSLGLEHGKALAEQPSYSLSDVWNEHRLLKRLLKAALRRPPALQHSVEDAVMDNLDRALAASAAEFARRRGDMKTSRTEERHKLDAIFSASHTAMALWCGPELVLELVNPAYQSIFPGRALLGRRFQDVLPEFRDQAVFELLCRVLETGEAYVGREQLARHRSTAGGPIEHRYYDFNYVRIEDAHGKPYGVYDHAIDVTARVLATRALREREEHLQEAVAELKRERTKRERLVAGISHDLRTPLSAARMSAYLVTRRADDQEAVRKNAARIADSLDRVDVMLRDLLDVSRISAGQELPLELEDCDLFELAETALMELRSMHGDRFVLQGDAPLVGVWSCAAVRRVLENLCNNAARYGSADQPISVEVERRGETALLRVHNQGQPIPADEMARLFEPFRQRQAASHRRHTGWGLGLTLVKGLAEAHGGNVTVESDAVAGTTFTVTLPLDARSARQQRDSIQPGAK